MRAGVLSVVTPNVDNIAPSSDVKDVIGGTDQERIDFIASQRHIIGHPQFDCLWTSLESRYNRSPSAVPQHMMISGIPGMGKSTLLEEFSRQRRRYKEGHIDIVPVLYVSFPPKATYTQILYRILFALDYLPNSRSNGPELLSRTLEGLRSFKVRMIILDEIQHAFGVVSANEQAVNMNLFKDLMNTLKVPIILAGLYKVCRRVYNFDQQIQWRVRRIETLDVWTYSEELADFLGAFEATLPLKENSELDRDEMVAAVATYCNGTTGDILNTIREAAEWVIKSGSEKVSPETFTEMGLKKKPNKRIADGDGDDSRS